MHNICKYFILKSNKTCNYIYFYPNIIHFLIYIIIIILGFIFRKNTILEWFTVFVIFWTIVRQILNFNYVGIIFLTFFKLKWYNLLIYFNNVSTVCSTDIHTSCPCMTEPESLSMFWLNVIIQNLGFGGNSLYPL